MTSSRLRLRTCAMIASATVLVLTCVAWERSKRFEDVFTYWRPMEPSARDRLATPNPHWRNITVELAWGAVYFQRGTYAYGGPPRERVRWRATPLFETLWGCSPASPDVRYALAGFSFSRWDRFPTWRNAAVRVPLWSVASVAAVMPALGLVTTLRRRRRFGAGCCTRCGYDLRATPARCPECGHVPDGAAADEDARSRSMA